MDSAFGVHPDFESYVGGTVTFKRGKGSVIDVSAKQKLNAESSTVAELVGVDHVLPLASWAPSFLKEQGHKVKENITKQDNKSTILLARQVQARELEQLTSSVPTQQIRLKEET